MPVFWFSIITLTQAWMSWTSWFTPISIEKIQTLGINISIKWNLRPSDVVWIWFKSILNIRRAGLIPPDLLKKKKKSLIGTALMVSINHFAIWDGIWECFEQRSDVNLFQTDIEGICNYIFMRLIPIQYIPDMQDFKNKSIVLWEYPKQENSIIYLHKKENHPCKK